MLKTASATASSAQSIRIGKVTYGRAGLVGRNVSIQSGGVGITFGGVAALGVTTTTIVGGTPSSQQSNASPAASKTAKTASLKGASLAALLSDESIFNRFGP